MLKSEECVCDDEPFATVSGIAFDEELFAAVSGIAFNEELFAAVSGIAFEMSFSRKAKCTAWHEDKPQ